MQIFDMLESMSNTVENLFIKQWKHAGYIDLITSDELQFVIDGQKYNLKITEIK